MNITRWQPTHTVYEKDNGDFVCYTDHVAALAERDTQLAEEKKYSAEKNETANVFMGQVRKLQAQLTAAEQARDAAEEERKARFDAMERMRDVLNVPDGSSILYATESLKADLSSLAAQNETLNEKVKQRELWLSEQKKRTREWESTAHRMINMAGACAAQNEKLREAIQVHKDFVESVIPQPCKGDQALHAILALPIPCVVDDLRRARSATDGRRSMSDPVFKVFHCNYSWRGSYGAYDEKHIIVVAETASRAHTWAVMDCPDTEPSLWTIVEIETTKDGSIYISGACS